MADFEAHWALNKDAHHSNSCALRTFPLTRFLRPRAFMPARIRKKATIVSRFKDHFQYYHKALAESRREHEQLTQKKLQCVCKDRGRLRKGCVEPGADTEGKQCTWVRSYKCALLIPKLIVAGAQLPQS